MRPCMCTSSFPWPCTADNASPSPPLGCCRLRRLLCRARRRLLCRRPRFPHLHQFRHPARLYRRLPTERRTEGHHEQTVFHAAGHRFPALLDSPPPPERLRNYSNLKMASKRFVVFVFSTTPLWRASLYSRQTRALLTNICEVSRSPPAPVPARPGTQKLNGGLLLLLKY